MTEPRAEAPTAAPSWTELEATIAGTPALLVYVEAPHCSVCHAVRPKIEAMLAEDFPNVVMRVIDAEQSPDIAAALQVFAFPVVLVYFDGRLALREVRNFSMGELAEGIARPYSILFEDDVA